MLVYIDGRMIRLLHRSYNHQCVIINLYDFVEETLKSCSRYHIFKAHIKTKHIQTDVLIQGFCELSHPIRISEKID